MQLSSWKAFPELVRLQIPIEFVLGCKPPNVDSFGQNVDDDVTVLDRINLKVPLANQLPPKLETLEILWGPWHTQYAQLYEELEELIKHGGIDGKPQLKMLFLGGRLGRGPMAVLHFQENLVDRIGRLTWSGRVD